MKSCIYGTLLTLLLVSSCAKKAEEPARADSKTNDGHLAPKLKNIGDLKAPITTKSADAQEYFNQGLTLVYGFNHAEALRSFKEVARLDPECAMAYWGQALALAPNINDPAIGPDREQQGRGSGRPDRHRPSRCQPLPSHLAASNASAAAIPGFIAPT